jgi:NTP pyrophosphatase (non-canonical NTP hydrolase)
MSLANALVEFHDFYGYDDESQGFELRKTLLKEEFKELIEELEAEKPDLQKIYKELADLLYVSYGLDVHIGGYLDEVAAEVHRSNMTKLWPCEACDGVGEEPYGPVPRIAIARPCKECNGTGKIVKRREDGKILKPPTYEKPDLSFLP